MELDPRLLEILRCPTCPEQALTTLDDSTLACPLCGRRYPVIEGIPKMTDADTPERESS